MIYFAGNAFAAPVQLQGPADQSLSQPLPAPLPAPAFDAPQDTVTFGALNPSTEEGGSGNGPNGAGDEHDRNGNTQGGNK